MAFVLFLSSSLTLLPPCSLAPTTSQLSIASTFAASFFPHFVRSFRFVYYFFCLQRQQHEAALRSAHERQRGIPSLYNEDQPTVIVKMEDSMLHGLQDKLR